MIFRFRVLRRVAGWMREASDRLSRTIELLCVAFLTGLVLIVGLKIIARYIAVYPMPWTEEVAKFLLTWSVLLGISVAFKKGELVASTYLLTKIPSALVSWVFALIQFFIFILLVVFMVEGWQYAITGWAAVSPILRIPLFFSYVVIPVTSALCLIHQLALVLNIDRVRLRAYIQTEVEEQ